MKRIVSATVAAVGITLVSATSAQAVTIPRIAGSYSVKETVTAHQSHPGDVGKSATVTFKFTPNCTGSNGCTTTLVRPRTSGHPNSVSTVLKPVQSSTGTWHYKGTKTYLSACFFDSGKIVDNAYSVKETSNLTVTNTNASNLVTAFKGTVAEVFTPTQIGINNNCASDRETIALQSLKKL
jgi:hypothetical protein